MDADGVDHDVTPCCKLGLARTRRLSTVRADTRKHLHGFRWRGGRPLPQLGHMPAFYGLLPGTSRGNDARQPMPDAQTCGLRLPWAASGLLASACSGFGSDDPRAGLSCIDDSQECVDQRQVTLKSMLDDQDRKWVKESTNAAGACLGRAPVRLPQPQEGAELRGAGARPPRGRQRAQDPAWVRRQEPVTGADLARQPCSPPRSARSSPPRCGRAAARREPRAAFRRCSGRRSSCAQTGRWSEPTAGPVPAAATASSGETKM